MSTKSHLQIARRLVRQGKYEAAIEILEEILADDPFNGEANSLLQEARASASPYTASLRMAEEQMRMAQEQMRQSWEMAQRQWESTQRQFQAQMRQMQAQMAQLQNIVNQALAQGINPALLGVDPNLALYMAFTWRDPRIGNILPYADPNYAAFVVSMARMQGWYFG